MDFEKAMIRCVDEIDRAVDKLAPWLIGFTFCYVTGHIIVAKLNGWM